MAMYLNSTHDAHIEILILWNTIYFVSNLVAVASSIAPIPPQIVQLIPLRMQEA